MKKLLLTSFLTTFTAFSLHAACVNNDSEISKPSSVTNQIKLDGASVNGKVYTLQIKAWKFACTQSERVGLAVSVKNIGTKDIQFNRSDVIYGGEGTETIKPSQEIYHVTEDNAAGDFEKNSTRITFSFFNTSVAPFKRSTTTMSKKLSSTSGLWYDPELSGTGFSFTDATVGLAATYYGYDKNGGKNWLNGVTFGPKTGEAEVGKDYSVNLNQPKPGNGGRFNNKPTGDASGTMSWGTMTINFTACDKATATLNGLDGTQVFNLVKLAGNAGVSCELK